MSVPPVSKIIRMVLLDSPNTSETTSYKTIKHQLCFLCLRAPGDSALAFLDDIHYWARPVILCRDFVTLDKNRKHIIGI